MTAVGRSHSRTRAARPVARRALGRARGPAGSKAMVERDGCSDYEPAIAALRSKVAALALLRRAKALGFSRATLEHT